MDGKTNWSPHCHWIINASLIRLNFKSSQEKETHIVVPNRPFYHNDEYLDDDESEQQIEMQSYNYDNDILAIDPQIFSLENFTSSDE